MALTRAQLLAGNQSNGVVLPGQPQGVIAGPGISISNTGIISVDSSSVTGLVKLNDPFAYNSYVWPGADGAAGEFLQTDGAGNLDWATPQGIAVVTVKPTPAPAPADIGELWFDCSTGTLNVYQDCVGSPIPNWFNVAQPGFPVDPGQTGAVPNFTGGNGTQATPYLMTVTSTGVGTTVAIVNTVTVGGLAPFQYVPIVDLNAVTNGGRFSFTNYYANSSGQLIFNTVFSDLPTSGPGQNYIAAIRVGYATAYIRASVTVTAALTLSQGTITGTPTVGTPVAYTPGVAAGGTPGYTYAYQWRRNGNNINLATSSTYTPVSADVGQTLSVVQTVTDSLGASVSNTTTASAQTATAPFPNATWGPTPSNGMDTNPGGVSGIYSGTGTTITVSGCIESAVYTPPALPSYSTLSKSITSGQTLAIRWTATALCGNANTNTTMNGTVSDGTYTNSYMLQINRVPAAIGDLTDTNVALGATVSKGINPAISGLNSVAYVTAGSGSTGTNIGVSLVAGGPFTPIPAAGSTSFPITNGQTLYVQQTVGGAVNTSPGYTAVVKVGDADGVLADEFTYFAQTVSSAVFPGLTFTPVGGPNAANETVSNVTGGGTLGTLNGVANSNSWPTGLGTTLSSPVSGANPTMKFRKGGSGAYVTSGLSINPSEILNLAWNEAYLATVADGGTANGSITGTVGAATYTNTFSMSVKRDAVWSIGTPVINAALNSSHSTSILLPDDYNVPVTVTFNNPTTGTSPLPMITGTISYAIDSNPTVLVTLGTTTATLNPGETLQVFGDVGGTTSQTYGVKIKIGTSAAQDWLVTTTGVTPSVQTPTIGPPANNSVNQGTSAGITINGDGYVPLNGAGAQASSTWEVYKANAVNPETSAITNVASNAATPNTWTQTAFANSGVGTLTSSATIGNTTIVGVTGQWLTSLYYFRTTDGGNSWSVVSSAFTSFVAAKGFFWGVGASGVYKSTDGLSWTLVRTLAISSSTFQSLAYNSATDTWVLVGAINERSTNDWSTSSAITLPGTTYYVTSANGVFLALQSFGVNVYKSTDGSSWTTSSRAGASAPLYSVVYAGGNTWYTAGSVPIEFSVSTDNGATWSAATYATNGTSNSLYYADGTLYVYTTDDKVAYSTNGASSWSYSSTLSPVSGSALGLFTTTSAGKIFLFSGTAGYYVSNLASTTLTLTDATDLASMQVGDTVVEVGGGADASGTITAISTTSPFTLTLSPSTGTWSPGVGATAKDTSRTIIPPAPPTTGVPNPTKYTAVTGSPFTVSSGTLTALTIAKPPLEANTVYYARVLYTSTLPVSSNYSSWSKFTTGSLLPGNTATLLATVGDNTYGDVSWSGTVYAVGVRNPAGDITAKVAYSPDLLNWSEQSIGSSATNGPLYNRVLWTGSRFLAFPGASTPGNTVAFYAATPSGAWTPVPGTAWINQGYYGILKDSNNLVWGSIGYWAQSSDGGVTYTSPTQAAAGLDNWGIGVTGALPVSTGVYYNGKYRWGLMNGAGTTTYIISSTTGNPGSWSLDLTASGAPTSSAASGTSMVFVGYGGFGINRSLTGNSGSFTQIAGTASGAFVDVAYGAGAYMVVGNSGTLFVSVDDGVTWTDQTASIGLSTKNFIGVAYLNNQWIANTLEGDIYLIS